MAIATFTTRPYHNMIDAFSKTLTRTPVTKTTSNVTGDETLTEGTAVSIQGALYKSSDAFLQNREGLLKGADAALKVKPDVTINKNDKISFNGETYRVDEVEMRYLGTVEFYKWVKLFLIT